MYVIHTLTHTHTYRIYIINLNCFYQGEYYNTQTLTLSGTTKWKFISHSYGVQSWWCSWWVALWAAHLQAVIQGPQILLLGSTIQRHISVILPAVLRNRTLRTTYSMLTYLSLGGTYSISHGGIRERVWERESLKG